MVPQNLMQSKASLVSAIDRVWAIDATAARSMLDALSTLHKRDMTYASDVLAYGEGGSGIRRWDLDESTGTARISIEGVMLQKPSSFDLWDGACSTIMVRRALREAVSTESVRRISLYIDSPGGQTTGMGELAADIAYASSQKPLTAFIDGSAFSAGYWAASQASRIVVNKFGFAGSIGVFTLALDADAFFQKEGLSWNLISSGGIKGHGAQSTNVSAEYLEECQMLVDHWASLFVTAVATGRGMDVDAVRCFADGRVWTAEKCLANGLVDRIMTEDEYLAAIVDMDDPDYWDDPEEQDPAALTQTKIFSITKPKEHSMETGKNRSLVAKVGDFLHPKQATSAPVEEAATGLEVPAHVVAMATSLARNMADNLINSACGRLAIPPSCADQARGLYLMAMAADHGGQILPDANGSVNEGPLTQAFAAFIDSLPDAAVLQATGIASPDMPAAEGVALNHNGSENPVAKRLKENTKNLAAKYEKDGAK